MPRMLAAVDFLLDKPKEIVIVKPTADATAEPLLAKLRAAFVPNRVLSVVTQGNDLERQQQVIPPLQSKVATNGKVTAYVCEHQIVLLGKGSVRVWEFIVAIEPTPADCYCCQVELRPQLHLAQGFPDISRWHLDDLDRVCRG